MPNVQEMTRKQAEFALRSAKLEDLPAFIGHPSNQVQKRARFLLEKHAQDRAYLARRKGKIEPKERVALGRVMRLIQPVSIAGASRDLGLSVGRVKIGLSAWGALVREKADKQG